MTHSVDLKAADSGTRNSLPSCRHAASHLIGFGLVAALAVVIAPWLWAVPEDALRVWASALVLLGVPHGALDHQVARPLLLARSGPWWFGAFALPYLALAAFILAGWYIAPALSLVFFLIVSVLHFGTEDAEGQGAVARLARGGLPVTLPILLHPERTARFFEILGGPGAAEGGAVWTILVIASWGWVPFAAFHVLQLMRQRDAGTLAEIGALMLVFAVLPPLAAFTFYFLLVHSPRHMGELARRHSGGWTGALRASLPLSLATLVMGALVFWSVPGNEDARFLRATFWGLAALTVPHMILHVLDRRRGGGPIG